METDMRSKCTILKMNVDVTSLCSALEYIKCLVLRKESAYVCLSNVHMCMEAFDSQDFKRIVNDADLVIPDGRPLCWAQRLMGHSGALQVRGQDVMTELCRLSQKEGLKIGLYGGSSDQLLQSVISKLKRDFPNINIVYSLSPPFRDLTPLEDASIVSEINSAGVDVLFVGIGCPKQERWMSDHKDKLTCVMLGVGAAYDFIAGHKKHAPRWVQKIGLEWLFRLISEPRRLWRRYLKQNPRFIYYFGRQWLFRKDFK